MNYREFGKMSAAILNDKNFLRITFLIISAAIFFACQNDQTNSNSAQITYRRTYQSTGVIKAIDIDAGKITLDHEDIPGYMAAMEMTEAVSDPKMLESLKVGDKVEFDLERDGSKLTVTKLTKIGEVVITSGGEIYKMNCAECHGTFGEGAEKGISLLKGHALKHSESEYVARVANGKGKKMPAFKDKLSTGQIAAVVRYVREELQKDVSKPAAEHKH